MLSHSTARISNIVLGTDKISGLACIDYIQRGLAAGYRMIDTAQVYNNEEHIGVAIRRSRIPRHQVFVTTKITAGYKKNPRTRKAAVELAESCCNRLGLDYVDVVLIHHPGDDFKDAEAMEARQVTWEGLEEAVRERWVRRIGVSNFGASHIREMREYATVMPCVNQVELHPWFQQREVADACKKANIQLQAYSAIARNRHCNDVELQTLAKKYNMSTVQLLLCYSLQKGYTPIMRATNPQHLDDNIKAQEYVISEKDMSLLDSWDQGEAGSLFPWVRHSD